MVAVSDAPPRIAGDGTPEAVWQAWPPLAAAPLLPLAAWLPAAARLVVVAPHPDDEVLACGALLALHAARGGAVQVVAVTDGEASHRGSARWSPAALAAARQAERLAGLAALGVAAPAVQRLRLPDGGVDAHGAALRDALQRLLRPGDRLVTTWRGDGHPDHAATGAACADVAAARGCALAEAPVWMWHWSRPGDPRVPWAALRRLPVPPAVRAAKQRAAAAHATQFDPADRPGGAVLGAQALARLARDAEHYLLAPAGAPQ